MKNVTSQQHYIKSKIISFCIPDASICSKAGVPDRLPATRNGVQSPQVALASGKARPRVA